MAFNPATSLLLDCAVSQRRVNDTTMSSLSIALTKPILRRVQSLPINLPTKPLFMGGQQRRGRRRRQAKSMGTKSQQPELKKVVYDINRPAVTRIVTLEQAQEEVNNRYKIPRWAIAQKVVWPQREQEDEKILTDLKSMNSGETSDESSDEEEENEGLMGLSFLVE